MIDAKAFGEELAGIVKAATAPLTARLDALEKSLDALPTPRDGKDADPEAVAALVRDEIRGDLDGLREVVDGIEIPAIPELPDIPAMVAEAVAEAIKAIPDMVSKAVDEAVSAIPAPRDGTSVSVDDVMPALEGRVQKFLDAIPVPKDGAPGESVTLDDVAPMIEDAIAKAVSAIPAAKDGADGVGLAGALIDRGGNLVVTLTNGEAKSLGPVVGKDAEPAEPGRDGLGFEDLDFETKDGRLYAVFRRDDLVKEARLPGISYRGGWKAGEYLTGDSVTFGACQWIATEDTDEKPGEGKAWQLAVRKGRDARGT